MVENLILEDLSKDLQDKLQIIENLVKNEKVLVALSGGLDSSLLAYLIKNFAHDGLAVTIESELSEKSEIKEAKNIAAEIGIDHRIIPKTRFSDSKFMRNDPYRCYYCKKGTFSSLKRLARDENYTIIVEGSNTSELSEHRPGLQALREEGIVSPFLEAKMNKDEIRLLARHIGLKIAEKPSGACLITRIPYHETITKEKLELALKAEDFLKKEFSIRNLRVRVYDGVLARIEVDPQVFNEILKYRDKIITHFKSIGFVYITLDLEGIRSGSMDSVLNDR